MQNQLQKTWFVTGASKGLGLAIVKQLLAANQKVAATSRNIQELTDAVGGNHANFLPLHANLGDDTSVNEAITATVATFGRLDVLINNAGYGIGGSLEEVTDTEIRNAFDINVFGTINTIRHALPVMRQQQSGHIINISSIAGFTPASGWAPYAATKFAVTGLTQALADDVRSLGIHATVVSPGGFRTSFLTEESLALPKNPISAYTAIRESHAKYLKMNGAQGGDPEKAAARMIELGFNPNPPVQLFLGTDAYNRATAQIEKLTNEIESNKKITLSTDY